MMEAVGWRMSGCDGRIFEVDLQLNCAEEVIKIQYHI